MVQIRRDPGIGVGVPILCGCSDVIPRFPLVLCLAEAYSQVQQTPWDYRQRAPISGRMARWAYTTLCLEMNKLVDLRSHFADFVRSSGGEVIDDTPQQPHQPSNADYIFHQHKVIAELKCLEKDQVENEKTSRHIDELLDKWNISRSVGIGEIQRIDLSNMPDGCVRALKEIKKAPLRDLVESASRQIKTTRATRNLNGYTGLLLVANDGDFSMPGLTIPQLLMEILNGSGSGINGFVFFTANMTTSVPGSYRQCLIWCYGLPRRIEHIDDTAIQDISDKWRAYLENITGCIFATVFEE